MSSSSDSSDSRYLRDDYIYDQDIIGPALTPEEEEEESPTDTDSDNEEEGEHVVDDDGVVGVREDASSSDDDWTYPKSAKHQPYIVSLFSFMDQMTYPKDTRFSKEKLLSIRPHHVRKWLCQRAYGKPIPEEGDHPTMQRSGSLKKAKSGVSFFHPDKHVPWLEGRGGNPTIHRSINDLISKVSAFETRGLGRKGNKKRPYSREEYFKILDLFREKDDFDHRYKCITMTLWAKHLIHRVDDTCHFKLDAPHGGIEYDFCIYTRTKWSKNVKNFRNCPDQIMFGSKNWKDCLYVHLAVYLEAWLRMNLQTVRFLFTSDMCNVNGPSRLNQNYINKVRKTAWENAEFKALEDQVGAEDDRQGIGGHSLRKFASTDCKRKGAHREEVEYRGRWIGSKNKSVCATSYIDTDDPYTDAYVAALGCDEGAVCYEVDDGMTVTDEWLFTNVIPHIRERYTNDLRFCRVVGKAHLWACFNEEARDGLCLGSTIRNRYNQDHENPDNKNPVKKIALEIINTNGRLRIIKVREDGEEATTGDSSNPNTPNEVSGQRNLNNRQLVAMMNNLERQMNEQWVAQQQMLEAQRLFIQQQFDVLNNNVRRYGGTLTSAFANQIRQQQEQPINPQERIRLDLFGSYGAIARNATLHPRVRDLYQLWEEWTQGIGGRKPAKNFTNAERNNTSGGIKQKFYRRLNVWKTQARLIDGGMALIAANDQILSVTGAKTVTGVINKLIAFKGLYKDDGGIHPNLKNS